MRNNWTERSPANSITAMKASLVPSLHCQFYFPTCKKKLAVETGYEANEGKKTHLSTYCTASSLRLSLVERN